jgi:hypothetical protein
MARDDDDDDDDVRSMVALVKPWSGKASDRAACVAALAQLQNVVLPRATMTAAAARNLLLMGEDDSANGPGRILLGIVGNGSVPEICRERAILLLKALLLKSMASDEGDNGCGGDGGDCGTANVRQVWSRRWIVQYYVDCCGTICRRIASSERHPACEREPSESIRLQLLLALSALLGLLPNFGDDGVGGSCDDDCATVLSRLIMEASSKLCTAMTEGRCPVLLDPYTAIHRETCHVIMQLAVKTPLVVAQHSSELLTKLVGWNSSTSTGTGTFAEDRNTGTCVVGLMSHRHAKSRSFALDAVTAILCCCGTGLGTEPGAPTIAPRVETLLESAQVLSRWEEGPVFDRSAQVRMSMQRSVGKVSRSFFWLDDDQTKGSKRAGTNGSPSATPGGRPSTSDIGRRLISLLLLGLSDDVECVRNLALEEMCSLRGEIEDDRGDGLLPQYANVVLLNLLQDATRASLVADKRVRILRAATKLLEDLIEASDMMLAFVGVDCNVSAAASVSAAAAAAISSSLCVCLDDDSRELSEAASTCARVLGADGISSALLIGTVLDTLRGGSKAGCFDDAHPFPGYSVSSSLSLLESLQRGHCSALSETDGGNDGHLHLLDIGATLHSEIVLNAIFTKDKSAASNLIGACDALVDVAEKAASFRGCSDFAPIVEHVLIAAMYILSATNETGTNAVYPSQPYGSAIDGLLGKAAALCGIGHCSGGLQQSRFHLMRRHFREVLSVLQPQDGVGESPHSSRHLGAVDALIRNSDGIVIAENYDVVGPILGVYASEEEWKFSIMVLLESVASDNSFAQAIAPPTVSDIVENLVLPNLVWRVGGLSAALRKVSLATLFSLLRGCSIEELPLTALALRIFPVLRSHLSDDDALTKELACFCIANIFDGIDPANLERKEISCLCVDMSRLLEDESNSVRIAACGALELFLSTTCSGQEHRGMSQLIIRQLQNHSSDPCHLIREAVSKALDSTHTYMYSA